MKSHHPTKTPLAFGGLLFLLLLGASALPRPDERAVQLLFTSDVYGYLEPCG
ncbi:MAG TPA: hypothetical protein VGA99_02490 [bacterium]